MHITGMTIGGILPFTKQVEFKFDERANLFIGPNASGKSTVLRTLQSRMPIQRRFDFLLSEDWESSASRRRGLTRNVRGSHGTGENSPPEDRRKEGSDMVPWVYLPATRLNLPLSLDSAAMHRMQSAIPAVRYIGDEEINVDPFGELHNSLSQYFFDGGSIQKYCKAVTDLFRMRKSAPNSIKLHQTAKDVAYYCVQDICSDVLTAGNTPSDYVYDQDVERGITITNVLDDMGADISDNPDEPVFIGDLSSGTQGTLLWIWYLSIAIANFYRGTNDWHKKTAILLIDEIENHLHPTWQRRVIPALLEHFPGLQIFATTHSPFVVAGLKAGQVHLLNRDASSVITASTNTEDIVGWTADEILRTMMGVEDPTDDATAGYARGLRQLRDAGPSADERDEERRQARMQELRSMVDRDLLAGGPRAAEDERFAENLTNILERYRQSQALNQENS